MENKNYSQRVTNEYGVKVWKHCFSCRHKRLDGEDDIRYCRARREKVHSFDVCPLWEMSHGLAVCGAGEKGRVKKPEFHRFIADGIRDKKFRNAIQFDRDMARLTELFKKNYGTIYIDGLP